jgi:lysozyme family protein
VKENFQSALEAVLHHEGGFVNHPADPGGMTNLGCTKSSWESWCGHPVDEKTMRELTPADVAPLYKDKYWDKVKGDDLPAGIDYCVFDCAINSGPGRAAKFLQECAGVAADGAIGPATLAAVQSIILPDLINLYCDKRLAFLKELKTWETFGKGWERRVEEVRSHALKMADRF